MNIKNCTFLKHLGINAIVLYPFVLYKDKKPSEELLRHENIHLDQIKRFGALGFYKKYVTEYFDARRLGLTHDEAYRNISFEREAFENSRKS